MQLKQFPPLHMIPKITARRSTEILIVGGGLTSAQLADLALRRGVSKVRLLMRGPLKVKYFDVDLDWVGKFRNYNQAAFWSADTDEGECACGDGVVRSNARAGWLPSAPSLQACFWVLGRPSKCLCADRTQNVSRC